MLGTSTLQWTGRQLLPAFGDGRTMGVKPSNNLTILAGAALAMLTSTAVNEVQRLTPTPTLSGGLTFFTWNGVQTLTSVPYNATAAQIKTCLETIPLLRGNITVTGGSLEAAFVAVTFINELAGMPQTDMTLTGNTLSGGGSIAVTTNTTGVAGNRWVAADITKITDPTTGPAVTNSTGGTLSVGAYLCQLAWVSLSGGETLPSYPVGVSVPDATNDRIVFPAINAANTPDDAQSVRYYANGVLVREEAVLTPGTGGNVAAYNLDAMPTTGTVGKTPVLVNEAYIYNDGRQNPTILAVRDFMTDPRGSVTYGQSGAGEQPRFRQDVSGYYGGMFLASDVAGLTAALLSRMGGKIIKGTFSDTTTCLVQIPAA